MSVENTLNAGLPFVCFRPPRQSRISFLAQGDFSLNRFSSVEETNGFLLVPFKESRRYPAVFLKSDFERVFENVSEFNASFMNAPQLGRGNPVQPTADHNRFRESVSKAVKHMSTGRVSKAIISRVERIEKPEGFSPLLFFSKLCEKYPNPYVYLFFHPEVGLWLGATPELLMAWTGNRAETVALAATKPHHPEAARDWTSKEHREFAIVADYVKNSLEKIPADDICVDGPFDDRSGNLLHLKSKFAFSLPNGFSISAFLRKFHPTPAISGFPKCESIDLIDELEEHDREYFCGYLGLVNRKQSGNLFVNLRCMKVHERHCELFVGCGITEDSNPDDEWRESVDKSHTLLNLLYE